MYSRVLKSSYGLACCRFNVLRNRLEVLLVKKRYTFCFIEFVLGRYGSGDDAKLAFLFDRMSIEEKIDIDSMDFDRIWHHAWLEVPIDPANERHGLYMKCRHKFERTFLPDRGVRLRRLLTKAHSQDCMWEIPKGKQNADESELACAMRELREEAGMHPHEYQIVHDVIRTVRYSNYRAHFCNKYYVAVTNDQSPADSISFRTREQLSEIIDVRWMGLEEVRFLDQTGRISATVASIFKTLKRLRIGTLTRRKILYQ